MAPAKVADRATANSNSGVTTVDLVLASLTVGNVLIIRTAADNSGGSGAARTVTVTNQSGTPIDVATDLAYQQNNDPGAASAGITCNVFAASITATSGTVRLTYSGSVVQAAVAEEWSGIKVVSGAPQVVGTPVGANGTASTSMASMTDASVASGNLAYGVEAIEGPATDVYTQDADSTNGTWSDLTRLGTTNATATDNTAVYGGYKVVTGTGAQTYNPTIVVVARDTAGLIVEFEAIATVEATLAAPLGELTSTATAVVEHPATLAAPLGGLTASMAADVTAPTVEAVLDAPLGSLSATAVATPEHPAVLAAPLGALVSSASATVEHAATLAAPLGSLTAAATATVDHPAVQDAPLGSLTAAATATVEHPAVLSAPLGALSATMTAEVTGGGGTVSATLDAPLGALAATATATVEHHATLDAPLGALVAGIIIPIPDPNPARVVVREAARTASHREPGTTHRDPAAIFHRE